MKKRGKLIMKLKHRDKDKCCAHKPVQVRMCGWNMVKEERGEGIGVIIVMFIIRQVFSLALMRLIVYSLSSALSA